MTDPSQLPLRDIHLPSNLPSAEIPILPATPGWWILTALVLIGVIGGWLLHRRRIKMKLSATHLVREQLRQIVLRYESEKDALELLQQLSVLLRRLSISLFPRTEVASLTGQAWLEFLDQQTQQGHFSKGTGRLLAEAPYRREVSDDEAEQVLGYCRQWIDTVTAGKRR